MYFGALAQDFCFTQLQEYSEMQRQAVRELTTQLQQMRQETAEKEAESRAWEERVAGLSQQLKEAHSRIEVRLGLGASSPAYLLDFYHVL